MCVLSYVDVTFANATLLETKVCRYFFTRNHHINLYKTSFIGWCKISYVPHTAHIQNFTVIARYTAWPSCDGKLSELLKAVFTNTDLTRCCHQMETFPALLALYEGLHRSTVVPLTKASNAELLCFLWSAPEHKLEQAIEMLVIWDTIGYVWRHWLDWNYSYPTVVYTRRRCYIFYRYVPVSSRMIIPCKWCAKWVFTIILTCSCYMLIECMSVSFAWFLKLTKCLKMPIKIELNRTRNGLRKDKIA